MFEIKHLETTGNEVFWFCRTTQEDSQWRFEQLLRNLRGNVSMFCRRHHMVSLQRRSMNRKVKERKKQLPKFCGSNKSAKYMTLGCFSPGCRDTPFLYLLWRKRSHLLRGQTLGQEDPKQSSKKQADTIIHCLCLRGAESWDVRSVQVEIWYVLIWMVVVLWGCLKRARKSFGVSRMLWNINCDVKPADSLLL